MPFPVFTRDRMFRLLCRLAASPYRGLPDTVDGREDRDGRGYEVLPADRKKRASHEEPSIPTANDDE
jgi:hypothetical protein